MTLRAASLVARRCGARQRRLAPASSSTEGPRSRRPTGRHHGLRFTDRYRLVVHRQSKYQAGRLRHYVSKLTRYLAKDAHGAEFLCLHHGERIYVAPWLTTISGLTVTIARPVVGSGPPGMGTAKCRD